MDGSDARILIAPFWANVDVTEAGTIFYRQVSTDDDMANVLDRATDEIRSCFHTLYDFSASFGTVVTWDEVSFYGFQSTSPAPVSGLFYNVCYNCSKF